MVFAGAAFLMPRGTFGREVAKDMGRALASAGVTALVFQILPPLPIYLGVPACILAFFLSALAVGLVRRSDVMLLKTIGRQRVRAPAAA